MVKKLLFFLLFAGNLSAQEKPITTVYFDFDQYSLNSKQITKIEGFLSKIDTAKVESIQIYGYCDDRGNDQYNYKLSNRRVSTVQEILLVNGFNKNKIIILEGKGRVIVRTDTVDDLHETRSKNRRVDLIVVKKNSYGHGVHNSFMDNLKVGDNVTLASIQFEMGSSHLTSESKKVLDKVASILNKKKNIYFEIQGHVCCTPTKYDDGIDKDTKERKLSWNRAKTVYLYLISKKIYRNRMTYKGYGNQKPLGEGEAKDRRVEFQITRI
ncbi:OmpA family protein [Flavobacterium agrisoli]|uniref:OmpA family protein n=1 Tax=Flavobacterium agrisoli TaxID=2793066 RepID=A0A934PLY7_9FLAO|nr:OmpA family protein [Flavobacterium agrisoli]MBK0369700.1 OmpA family protein [Flavobacterium agrisoli]